MVIGDARKYLTVLLTFKSNVNKEGIVLDTLSEECIDALKKMGSNAKTVAEAKKDPIIIKAIDEGIKAANTKVIS
jgi:hypothetical protein